MVGSHIDRLAARCSAPGRECFVADLGALDVLLHGIDILDKKKNGLLMANMQRVAAAAMAAGNQDIPLEDATYVPAVPATAQEGELWGQEEPIVSGNAPEAVLTAGGKGVAYVQNRVARCAYVCGKNAASCVLQRRSH